PDTTPPVLSLPVDLTAEAEDATGATVTFVASASDAVDVDPTVTCAPASGARFPLGTSSVECTATDDSGNTSTGSFSVNVVDTTAPVVTAPDELVVQATGPSGATVEWSATALDAVDASVDVTCDPPPGTFPVGTTDVTCRATDDAGNTGEASFGVTVTPAPDTEPPVLTLPSAITTEATGPSGATVSWTATATDDVDGAVPVTCSHEPGTFPVGATTVSC